MHELLVLKVHHCGKISSMKRSTFVTGMYMPVLHVFHFEQNGQFEFAAKLY